MNKEKKKEINAILEEDLMIEDDNEFFLKALERVENDKEGFAFYAKYIIKKLNYGVHDDLKCNAQMIRMYLFCRYLDFFDPFFGYQPYFEILDDFIDNVYFEKRILMKLKEELKRIKKETAYEDIRLIFKIQEQITEMIENRQNKYEKDIHLLELELKGISLLNERNKPLSNQEMEEKVLEKLKILEQRKMQKK